MKKRIILIFSIIIMFVFASGITYSIFNSDASLSTLDQKIAEFIFNTDNYDSLDLPIAEIKPGDTENYFFAVTNTQESKNSKVNITYQIIIKTYHFIPFEIELYNLDLETEVLVGTCDETYSRNELNELVCNMPETILNHSKEELKNYRLSVKFPEEYNDEIYSGLVDFINLEIKSWQKIGN